MSSKAASIALGSKQAEINAAQKHNAQLKAQVAALEKRIKDNAAKLKKSFASFGVTLPDDFTKEDLDLAFAFVESFNIKTQQIADQQVAALGFTPKSELDAAMQSCFQK
jgi:CRISPR/Cas system CMR-associated protein Cmr5 small subunit